MSRKLFLKKSSTSSFIPSLLLVSAGFASFFFGNPSTCFMLTRLPLASKVKTWFISTRSRSQMVAI